MVVIPIKLLSTNEFDVTALITPSPSMTTEVPSTITPPRSNAEAANSVTGGVIAPIGDVKGCIQCPPFTST